MRFCVKAKDGGVTRDKARALFFTDTFHSRTRLPTLRNEEDEKSLLRG